MIQLRWGNLLDTKADALVATVNCVGVMGKGLALQVKLAFPENFEAYKKACDANEMRPGAMLTVRLQRPGNPRYVINFPTKRHWKGKSRLEDIDAGLRTLASEIQRLELRSVAVPPLGCGNGGLDWDVVRPRIIAALDPLANVEVYLYAPQEAPDPRTMPVATARPELTPIRALFIELLALYSRQGLPVGRLEMQKLAYLLQEAGQPLGLKFKRHHYGPYSGQIDHVIEKLEGHYVRGFGDKTTRSQLELMPQAIAEARKVLRREEGVPAIIGRVARLVDGFESPYGLELLATVHAVCKESREATKNLESAIRQVQAWSPRKHAIFGPDHIAKAWNRLHEQGWFGSVELAAWTP